MACDGKPITPDLAAALRAAVEADGRTAKQIAVAAGVPQPTLSRWLNGTRPGLSLGNLSKLCRELGLELKSSK